MLSRAVRCVQHATKGTAHLPDDAKWRRDLMDHVVVFLILRARQRGVKRSSGYAWGTSRPEPGPSRRLARLQLPAAFHGLEHGDFVGIFDVAAHRNSHGDAGYAQALPLQLLGEVGGGGFAFDRGIGREDDFLDVALGDAAEQVADA